MHKAKALVEDFRKYLGSDKEGLRRLNAIAEEVNELRKQSASARESADSAERAAKRNKDIAVVVQNSCDTLRTDLHREQSINAQLAQQNKKLQDQVEQLRREVELLTPRFTPAVEMCNPEEMSSKTSDSPLVKDFRPFAAMFDALRKEMRMAPRPSMVTKRHRNVYTYELTDIINSLDPDQLLKLGRFVVAITLMNMPAYINAERNFTTARSETKRLTRDEQIRPFVRWFYKNIGKEDVMSEELWKKNCVNKGCGANLYR